MLYNPYNPKLIRKIRESSSMVGQAFYAPMHRGTKLCELNYQSEVLK